MNCNTLSKLHQIEVVKLQMKWSKEKPKINKPCILLVHNTFRNLTTAYNFVRKNKEYVAMDETGFWVGTEIFNNDNCLYLILDTPKEKEE